MIEDLEHPIHRKAPSTLPESPHELVLALAAEEANKIALATLALDLVRHVGKVLEPVGGDHLRRNVKMILNPKTHVNALFKEQRSY